MRVIDLLFHYVLLMGVVKLDIDRYGENTSNRVCQVLTYYNFLGAFKACFST